MSCRNGDDGDGGPPQQWPPEATSPKRGLVAIHLIYLGIFPELKLNTKHVVRSVLGFGLIKTAIAARGLNDDGSNVT